MKSGTRQHVSQETFDILGLGFGPANLALAIALEESEPRAQKPRSLFIEQKSDFAWHPEMLLDDAELQISFFKDLVTLKNPCSRFSFLNYLHQHNRLQKFANLRSFFPSRVEFNDYLQWAAHQVQGQVQYDQKVIALEPLPSPDDGRIRSVLVRTQLVSGESVTYKASNLVLGLGATPKLPHNIQLNDSPRAFHSSQYLSRINALYPNRSAKFTALVVGSGQSSAEIVDHLLSRYDGVEVTVLMRRLAFRQSDESQFVNEVFGSEFVDLAYALPPDLRAELLNDLANTNYSAVDIELVERLYKRDYIDGIRHKSRLKMRVLSEITALTTTERGIEATYRHRSNHATDHLRADIAVLATGFSWPRWHPMLAPFAPWRHNDSEGEPLVCRNYRLDMSPGCDVGIYLQGYCEPTHGLSDTLLSLLPFRAGTLLDDIMKRKMHFASGSQSAIAFDSATEHLGAQP
jgi:L-ornithine N5-monooxygenase